MFRSAFGIVCLVLLGFGVLVSQGIRAESVGSEGARSVEANEVVATDALVSGGTGILGASKPVGRSGSGVRPRRFGGEPSMLLLLGVALFGAAHYARRPTRTHQ